MWILFDKHLINLNQTTYIGFEGTNARIFFQNGDNILLESDQEDFLINYFKEIVDGTTTNTNP